MEVEVDTTVDSEAAIISGGDVTATEVVDTIFSGVGETNFTGREDIRTQCHQLHWGFPTLPHSTLQESILSKSMPSL